MILKKVKNWCVSCVLKTILACHSISIVKKYRKKLVTDQMTLALETKLYTSGGLKTFRNRT